MPRLRIEITLDTETGKASARLVDDEGDEVAKPVPVPDEIVGELLEDLGEDRVVTGRLLGRKGPTVQTKGLQDATD